MVGSGRGCGGWARAHFAGWFSARAGDHACVRIGERLAWIHVAGGAVDVRFSPHCVNSAGDSELGWRVAVLEVVAVVVCGDRTISCAAQTDYSDDWNVRRYGDRCVLRAGVFAELGDGTAVSGGILRLLLTVAYPRVTVASTPDSNYRHQSPEERFAQPTWITRILSRIHG